MRNKEIKEWLSQTLEYETQEKVLLELLDSNLRNKHLLETLRDFQTEKICNLPHIKFIKESLEKLYKDRLEIQTAISIISNPRIKIIMAKRFLLGMSLKELTIEYADSSVSRLIDDGIEEIKRKLIMVCESTDLEVCNSLEMFANDIN
jgi:hypothetical protein